MNIYDKIMLAYALIMFFSTIAYAFYYIGKLGILVYKAGALK